MKSLTNYLTVTSMALMALVCQSNQCNAQQKQSQNKQVEQNENGVESVSHQSKSDDAAARLRMILKEHEDNLVEDAVDREKLLNDFRKLADKIRSRSQKSDESDDKSDVNEAKSGESTPKGNAEFASANKSEPVEFEKHPKPEVESDELSLKQRVEKLERELEAVNEKLNWLYQQFTHQTGK